MSNSASDIESTPQQEVATQTAGQTPVLSAQSAPAPQPQPALASSPGSTDPTNAPGVVGLDISARTGADVDTGSTPQLAWGARSDVGLIREHNEDSFLIHAPVFCVCDGMVGHAAGEVASAIAVRSIAEHAPVVADDTLLGAAVELANTAIIKGAQEGVGRPGMGCTATAAVIENKRLAVAHVGDSRLYILHEGTLVRVTRDHSFVEELVDAGEITADEARVHPSRSVITRALGSDPHMYADHFSLDIEPHDRIILCSDGLSSMMSDHALEDIAVSSATPQQAADNLVAAALAEGGYDNVTVIVIDVLDKNEAKHHRSSRVRTLWRWSVVSILTLAVMVVSFWFVVRNSWYIGENGTTVAVYQGINASLFGIKLNSLFDTTSIQIADLPESTQRSLKEGIGVASPKEAQKIVENYRGQIDKQKSEEAKKLTTTSQQTNVAELSYSAKE